MCQFAPVPHISVKEEPVNSVIVGMENRVVPRDYIYIVGVGRVMKLENESNRVNAELIIKGDELCNCWDVGGLSQGKSSCVKIAIPTEKLQKLELNEGDEFIWSLRCEKCKESTDLTRAGLYK